MENTNKELSQLTDQELINEGKKIKSNAITNAVFVGVMVGIIFYSIVKSTLGFLTLIPLYFIYRAVTNSKREKAIEQLLKERNLK